MGVRTGCQVRRYTSTVQHQTATATATTTATATAPPPLAVAVGFGLFRIELEKESLRTAWDMTNQTFQKLGLKLNMFTPTFRDLGCHLCQIIMRVAGWEL